MKILGRTLLLLFVACATAPGCAFREVQLSQTPTANESVQVPFDLNSGRPVVQAQIGDRTVEVEFDTGAQGALIPKALADAWGLKVVGKVEIGSPFGKKSIEADLVSMKSLNIGGAAAVNVHAAVEADSSFRGPDARIVISAAQFGSKYVTLDYVNQKLIIADAPPPASGDWQAMKNGLPEGYIELQGERVAMHIDSGNPSAIMLPTAFADKLDPKPQLQVIGRARVVDKEFPLFIGKVNADATLAGVSIRLGDVIFGDVPYANLGSQGLKHFQVVLDLANQRWKLISTAGLNPVLSADRPTPRPR